MIWVNLISGHRCQWRIKSAVDFHATLNADELRGNNVREADRMRLLVVDACETMSRMSDRIMLESANGISEHLEDVLLGADENRVNDICTSSLVVALAILKPLSEQLLASTDGRYSRARAGIDDEEIEQPVFK